MSGGNDAEVRVGIVGAEDVGAGASQAFAPWERAGAKVMSGLERIGATAGQAFAGVASDLVRVGTALGAVDLGSLAGRYRTFTEDVARMGVATGKSIDDLKGKFKGLAEATGISDERWAKIASGMQRATHTEASQASLRSIGAEALATGRAPEEQAGMAVALQNTFGIQADQVAAAFGKIDAAAEKAGVAPGRLQDQFIALGGALGRVSIQGVDDVGKLAVTIASIGKGMRPEQQAQAQQKFFSFLTSDPEQLRREMGMKRKDFYNDQGQIKDFIGVARKYRAKELRDRGGRENALRVSSENENFGPIGAIGFYGADLGDEKIGVSDKALRAQRRFVNSDVGKDVTKRALRDATDRETGGKTIDAMQETTRDYLPDNPLLRYGLLAIGGKGVASTIGRLVGGGGGGAGGGGGSYVGRAGSALLRLAGGGSAGVGLAAVGASLATMYAGFKTLGLDKFNEAMPQITGETAKGLADQREGRARAIIRTVANYDGDPRAIFPQLGPKLVGEINRDPVLQTVAQAAVNQQIDADALNALPENIQRAVEAGFGRVKIEITNLTGLDGMTAEPKRQ